MTNQTWFHCIKYYFYMNIVIAIYYEACFYCQCVFTVLHINAFYIDTILFRGYRLQNVSNFNKYEAKIKTLLAKNIIINTQLIILLYTLNKIIINICFSKLSEAGRYYGQS